MRFLVCAFNGRAAAGSDVSRAAFDDEEEAKEHGASFDPEIEVQLYDNDTEVTLSRQPDGTWL
jgi:hypothetical protein